MLSASLWRSDDLPADLLKGLRAERTFVSAGGRACQQQQQQQQLREQEAVTAPCHSVCSSHPAVLAPVNIFHIQCEFAPSGRFSDSPFVLASV